MSAVLALDLGTSAFKCATVAEGQLLTDPVEAAYTLHREGDTVTMDQPETYAALARSALAQGAARATEAGVHIEAIGICSQAQTYVPMDRAGHAVGPGIVWQDGRASAEAEELESRAWDWDRRTGFPRPSPQQFLPKVMGEVRHLSYRSDTSFLLLPEFITLRLTGETYGDTTLQGMGGFYDLAARAWNEDYLRLARIGSEQLAPVFPAAEFARPLLPEIAEVLNTERVPVYSCGNDQCCAAIGAGLSAAGGPVCSFGTAMVIYTLTSQQRVELADNQIAGVDPLTGGWFLLAYESECGNLIDRARSERLPTDTVDDLILSDTANDVTDGLSRAFGRLLDGLELSRGTRFIATGGLSRSDAWLGLLERDHGLRFEKSPHAHTSLLGVAAVLEVAGRFNKG